MLAKNHQLIGSQLNNYALDIKIKTQCVTTGVLRSTIYVQRLVDEKRNLCHRVFFAFVLTIVEVYYLSVNKICNLKLISF